MNLLLKIVKRWANYRSFKAAVKEADRLRATTFKKHLVLYIGGEFRPVAKQRLKDMHKRGLVKNCSIRTLEKGAVYTTK